MIVMYSLALLALKQLKACKNRNAYCFVVLYFQTISFNLRENFDNWNSGADVPGHDVQSLKAKKNPLLNLSKTSKVEFFFSVDKPILMVFYHSRGLYRS